ncbi:lipocalin-like domain-containing protein [Oryzibacter oryziterrae]|uniref:lipocalin-like domain-containing protein n=1 Tax=Oryzibacter oryziterrae TaxID=2766474 RepID=UPI001F2A843D|nr:lipocalin-like domain-containing protein [Oryzibacter oryziterrae]
MSVDLPLPNRRAFVAGVGMLAAATCGAVAGQAAPGGKTYSSWLVGTWMMESFTTTDDKGVVADAMGPGALGVISYSADGWMSVQIMRPDRKPYDHPDLSGGTPEQTIEAARTFFAYAGPYDVDEANGIVYHNLQFSLMPNWLGGRQKRYIAAEGDDILVLSGDPVLINGKTQVTHLRWKRRKA